MQVYIFIAFLLIAFATTAGLAVYAFRQGARSGSGIFAAASICESLVILFEMVSLLSPSSSCALFWFSLQEILLSFVPVLLLLFLAAFYEQAPRLTRKIAYLFFAIPTLSLVFVLLQRIINLWSIKSPSVYFFSSVWLVDTGSGIPGIWYFIQTIHTVILLLAGILIVLVDLFKNRRINNWLSALLMSGNLVLLITFLLPDSILLKPAAFDLSLLGISISSFLYLTAAFTTGFPKIHPDRIKTDSTEKQEQDLINLLILVFVIIALSITSMGILSYKNFERQQHSQIESQLTSVSLLKVSEIQKWRNERLNDAEIFYNNSSFAQLVESYQQDPGDSETKALLNNWLSAVLNHDEYDLIILIDSTGNRMLSAPESDAPLPSHLLEDLPIVLNQASIHFEDFHKDSQNSPIYLTLMIPIYSSKIHTPLGMVAIRINPQIYLYPMILNWPVPSETAETAIIRMEDNEVLYLSDLKFLENAALNLTIDLSETHRPSVKAVTGSIGIVEGVNYRDNPVIADVRPIPDTPWFLISRIDKDEAFAPIRERAMFIWILSSAIIITTFGALLLIWRWQKMRSLIARNSVQAQINESDRKLKEAQELAHLGFWYWDIATGDVEWSEEVYKIFQLNPEEFKPKIDTILALSPWPEDQQRDQELIQRSIETKQPGMYEQKFLRPDHSIGHYSSTFQGLFDEKGNLKTIVGSVLDITERVNKDQALRDSEKRFRTLFEHAAVGVAIMDAETGEFHDINKKFYEFFGYSKEEIVNQTNKSIEKAQLLELEHKQIKQLLSGKISEITAERQYVRKDGKTVWGFVVVSPLWESGEKKSAHQLIVVINETTEQKIAELALKESEKRFRETVTNLDEGYYCTTLDGKVITCNQAFRHILDIPASVDNSEISTAAYWQNAEERKNFVEMLKRDGYVRSFEIEAKTHSGEKRTILANVHLQNNDLGQPGLIEGVILDITERIIQEEKIKTTQVELQKLLTQAEQSRRALLTIVEDQKMAQEEIRRLNKTLEERVNERTAELKTSNEELESFAYSISHDLRAPLRAIDGYSRILEQDYASVLDEEGIRLIKIVRNSTKNMDDLITDLLSLSRVGRSELKFQRIDMKSLAISIFQELVPPENQEKISFKVSDLPETNSDPTLIRHVWINLISNSIKYSAPKENPEIVISGFEDEEKCTYTIKDNGVGFNPRFKDKLFNLFQRLHKASEFEGTGVGLAVVQRIIRRHGGQVWGDGIPDEGAEFTFTLPKRKEENG